MPPCCGSQRAPVMSVNSKAPSRENDESGCGENPHTLLVGKETLIPCWCKMLASPHVARDSTLGHPPEGNENRFHPTLTWVCSREPCRGQAPSGDDRTSTQLWLTGCNVDTSPDPVLREGSQRPEATRAPHDPVPTESPAQESPRRHSTTGCGPVWEGSGESLPHGTSLFPDDENIPQLDHCEDDRKYEKLRQ